MILIDTQKEEFSKLKDIRVFGKISHENRFNKNFLVIGLGGLGSRAVCALKGMLVNDITPEDNINFLMIDSDISEMERTIEDSKEGVGFNALEVISIYRPDIENVLENGIQNNKIHKNLDESRISRDNNRKRWRKGKQTDWPSDVFQCLYRYKDVVV